jgi:mono/diheme cytochrome c family protein
MAATACLLALAPLAAGCVAASERDANAVARGQATVEQWCAMCHSLAGRDSNPERAPTFEEIANRPGRDRDYLRRFLDEDHFPMTTYRLFDHEKRDVAEFIASLGER